MVVLDGATVGVIYTVVVDVDRYLLVIDTVAGTAVVASESADSGLIVVPLPVERPDEIGPIGSTVMVKPGVVLPPGCCDSCADEGNNTVASVEEVV